MPVTNNPLVSLYGFQSPAFSVDALGNTQVNSLISGNTTVSNITITGTLSIDSGSIFNNTIAITDSTAAINSSLAALTVAGGVGIEKNLIVDENASIGQNLNVYGDLNVNQNLSSSGSLLVQSDIQTNATLITSFITTVNDGSTITNLEIEPLGDVIFKTQGQSTEVGRIDATGSNVPVQNTTINNTTIGATTPSSAAFTSTSASSASFVAATVANTPTVAADITRKDYVDRTAIALAVAFGA